MQRQLKRVAYRLGILLLKDMDTTVQLPAEIYHTPVIQEYNPGTKEFGGTQRFEGLWSGGLVKPGTDEAKRQFKEFCEVCSKSNTFKRFSESYKDGEGLDTKKVREAYDKEVLVAYNKQVLEGKSDFLDDPNFEDKLQIVFDGRKFELNYQHPKALERWGRIIASENPSEAHDLACYARDKFVALGNAADQEDPAEGLRLKLRGMKAFARCALAIYTKSSDKALGQRMIERELRPSREVSKKDKKLYTQAKALWEKWFQKMISSDLEKRKGCESRVLTEANVHEAVKKALRLAKSNRKRAAKSLLPFVQAFDLKQPHKIYQFIERKITVLDEGVAARAFAELAHHLFEEKAMFEAFASMRKAIELSFEDVYFHVVSMAFKLKAKSESIEGSSKQVQEELVALFQDSVYNSRTGNWDIVYAPSPARLKDNFMQSYKDMLLDVALVGPFGWVGAAVRDLLPPPGEKSYANAGFEVVTDSESDDERFEEVEEELEAPDTVSQQHNFEVVEGSEGESEDELHNASAASNVRPATISKEGLQGLKESLFPNNDEEG